LNRKPSTIHLLMLSLLLVLAVSIAGCGPAREPAAEPESPEEPAEPETPSNEDPEAPEDDPEAPEEDPTAEDAPTHHVPGEVVGTEIPEGPSTREGVIMLEGMEEPIELFRHHAEALGLVTYIPEDLAVGEATGNTPAHLTIHSAYVDHVREDVYLRLSLYADDTDFEALVSRIQGQFEDDGYDIYSTEEARLFPWASHTLILQGLIDGEDYVAVIGFGNLGHRPLVAISHMPVEFSGGTEPRFAKVLENAQWYLPE